MNKLTVKRIVDLMSQKRRKTFNSGRRYFNGGVLIDRERDMRTETMMDKGQEPWFIFNGIKRKTLEKLAEKYDYEPIFIEGGFDWAPSIRERSDYYEPTDFWYGVTVVPKKGKPFSEWELKED